MILKKKEGRESVMWRDRRIKEKRIEIDMDRVSNRD